MFGSNTANIKAVITAEDRASKTLAGFGGRVGSLAKKSLLAFGAVTAAATAFGVSSVKSYEESQNALTQLNAVLKSTKGAAGVTARAATNLATSLQKVTKYSDEDVMSAENMLLTFTKINKRIFPETTKIVLDMSTALGQDLKSSAIQVGKALQDPILGVTALRRVGVNFNTEAKNTIKRLVETGQSAKAQALILKELRTEFGGSAVAAGQTFAGKLAILRNQLDEVKESIGGVIVNAITPFAQRLAAFVSSDKFQAWIANLNQWLKVNIPIAMNYVSNVIIPLLASAFKTIWPVVKVTIKVLAGLLGFLADHKWIVQAFVVALIGIKTGLMIGGAAKVFSSAMKIVRREIILTNTIALTRSAGVYGLVAALGTLLGYKVGRELGGGKPDPRRGTGALLKPTKGGLTTGDYNIGGYASGTDYASGGWSMVGERGPELVNLSRGSQVIPNDRLNGSTVNFNVNIGMYAGSQMEKRKIAKELFGAYQELMSSRGTM